MTPKKTQNPIVRWKWSLLDSGLPSSARLVLLTLAVHMDDNGRRGFPSIALLSRETGLSKRTVVSHIQKAVDAGWITIRKIKTDEMSWPQNSYVISWPASGATIAPDSGESGATIAPDSGESGATIAPDSGESGATIAPDSGESGANNSMQVVQPLHTNSTRNSTTTDATTKLAAPAPEPEPIAPDPVRFDGVRWTVDDAVYDQWIASYTSGRSASDTEDWIEQELAKAAAWLMANPRKRKKNYLRFLTGWLTRASDSMRSRAYPQPRRPYH